MPTTTDSLARFDFGDNEVRTVRDDNGEIWFVAADVARILGYSSTESMTRSIDPMEKGMRTLHTLGGSQAMTVITEPGLYEAASRSTLPKAVDFRRWIYRTVLPEIRQTGSYNAPAELSRMEILTLAMASEQRALDAEGRVAELEPAAAHAETFRAAEGLRTIGDVANDFKAHCAAHFPGVKVLHQEVFDHAGRLGIVIRGNTVRRNQPTGQAVEAGWAKPHRAVYDTITRGAQTAVSARLTPRGEQRLWDGLCAWVGAHGSLHLEAAAA